MDSAPRMPQQRRRRMLERSATTNEPPKRTMEEPDLRLSPPLEIFVRELSLTGPTDSAFDVSMTEVTFDASFCLNSSGLLLPEGGGGLSVTSSVSSLVDYGAPPHHPCASGDGTGERCCRLPPRRQSHGRRRPRNRKGVARWASMPMSNLPKNRTPEDDANNAEPQTSPRLPKRRCSNPSILGDEELQDDSDKTKEQPRLPIRKKSSESLFSKVKASDSCATTEEIVVSAHAA